MSCSKGTEVIPRSVLIVAILILVIGGGAAAAFTVPAVSLSAEKSVGEMLPVTTVLYLSADLNPQGAKKDYLERIEHAFSDQPSWQHVREALKSQTKGNSPTSGCYTKTQREATSNLDQLGHTAVFAVIDSRGIDFAKFSAAPNGGQTSALTDAVKRNAVFLAPLATQLTLIQAIGGKSLQLQHKSTDYNGTPIYQESFSDCGKVSQTALQTVYAALYKGYVVLGLMPDPIERIIDTGNGKIASLATDTEYKTLQSQLSGDPLGGYFLSGPAIKTTRISGAIGKVNPASASASRDVRSSAGAVFAESYGFRVATATLTTSNSADAQPATVLAGRLPADTLGLIAVQRLAPALKTWEHQLANQGNLTGSNLRVVDRLLNDITADMSGETDLALLHSNGIFHLSSKGGTYLPLLLTWQVRDEATANAHLADIFKQAKLSNQLQTYTASDGTTYHATTNGYGYAVRGGWAITSPSIAKTLDQLAQTPSQTLASRPLYHATTPSGVIPSTTWYFDVTGLRQQAEDAYPNLTSGATGPYRMYVQPVLAPIHTITGSGGLSGGGKITVTTVIVGIGKPS